MADFPVVPLAELTTDQDGAIAIGPFGSAMKADTYVSEGVRVVRGTNISDARSWKGDWVFVSEDFAEAMPRCEVSPGDLVFPHRGSIGEVAIVPNDGRRYFLSTSLMKATISRDRADPLFVYYYLKSAQGKNEILRFSSQVGTPGIGQPLTSLRQFRVPAPPLSTQSAIASVLAALDDKIDLNRRMNETLEAMARALFKDWFVDFGPTRARAEGREPCLAPDIWSLFPDRLDDEGKPEGWEWRSLSHYASLNPESWTAKTYPPEVSYVDLSNTKWGAVESVDVLARENAPSRAQRILREGDTIVGTVRPANGSYALIGRAGLTGSTGFAVLRPKQPVSREIIYLAATAPENIEHLSHLADGAAYPAVRPDVVLATDVVAPGDELVAAFHRIVAPLHDKIAANRIEIADLATTRDYLLPKLMSGEIRVRDAAKIAEAAA